MAAIVLTTLNARYAHAAFGLRYLMANLGELRSRARVLEFDINQRPLDILERILEEGPAIVGVGVYIWNAVQSLELVVALKRLRPGVVVVLGGPEVSHETEGQEIVGLADYVITGEADLAFAELCRRLLRGERPVQKVIMGGVAEFSRGAADDIGGFVELPYDLYDERDIAQRVVYVEASRGCPFRCEFCLSSLDVPLRNVPLEVFLPAMQDLLDRGLRQFKFVDRTFNLNLAVSRSILQFFLDRYSPGLFLHFEMIPDRLPEALRELIRRFPPGALQFEVGVQTFNEAVAARISRRQDNAKVEENLRFLRQETGVHIHADLIAGLPGEDLPSFAAGFDRLVALGPQEIQLGILKRLRGTPIARHTAEWGMVYSPVPPYEVLETKHIDFATMQRVRRLARYWDLVGNSGHFVETTALLWAAGSPFAAFLRFADWLHGRAGQRTHGIALNALAEFVSEYLTRAAGHAASAVAPVLARDLMRGGRRDCPEFLRAFVTAGHITARDRPAFRSRQARHRGGVGEGL